MPRKSSVQNPKEIPTPEEKHSYCCNLHSDLFWPIFLIVIGFVWLARNLGWLGPHFPWFPLALIAFGVYLLCARTTRKKEKSSK